MGRKRTGIFYEIAKYTGIALIVFLLIGCGIMLSNVLDLRAEADQMAKVTPTPTPHMDSVMAVTPDPSAPTPSAISMIKTGAKGNEVTALQQRLKELGYYAGEVDGQFGPATRDAVTYFQNQHGLDADGIVGPATRDMLNSNSAQVAIPTPSPSPSPTPATTGGLPLLVNRANPLPADYAAENLVYLKDACPSDLVTIKGNDIQGNATAVAALNTMLRAAHGDGLTLWQVSAGYRSVAYQQTLFDAKVAEYQSEGFSKEKAISATRQTITDPGSSEHHTGLAFDITVPGETFKYTSQSKWLAEHCWEYGFIIRYQEDKTAITGILAEPWHVRYVGIDHSIPMRDDNLCLEEYIAALTQ